MPRARVTFHKLIQDSQDYGSNDEHMVSRVFFTLEVETRIRGTLVLKQLIVSRAFVHWSRTGSMPGQFLIVDKPYDNMLNVGYRSVRQERRRLRDGLSDDRNAQNLFKGFLGKCND